MRQVLADHPLLQRLPSCADAPGGQRVVATDRRPLALLLQSRISEIFHVDIHPRATVGQGVMLDHATGVVIGETAVIGNNVSILHGVTLGGTGVKDGDRHPKIGDGAVIGAGSPCSGTSPWGDQLENRRRFGGASDIPPNCTAVGIPARVSWWTEEGLRAESRHGSGVWLGIRLRHLKNIFYVASPFCWSTRRPVEIERAVLFERAMGLPYSLADPHARRCICSTHP